jgi:uncharacterized phage-associated protein
MAHIQDVVAYILERRGPMAVMKLQKLCYYAYGYHLAWEGRRLFPERFEAWANGPVAPALYKLHRGRFELKAGDIPGNPSALTAGERDSVDLVLHAYGDLSADQLSVMTHSEPPQRPPGALWGKVGGDGPVSAVGGVNPALGVYLYVLDRIPVPHGAPDRAKAGLMIEQGTRTALAPLTPDDARTVAGWLYQCARPARGRAEGQPDMEERVVKAEAVDGDAMSASELRAFLADVGGDVPDEDVRIRAQVGHLGDIRGMTALIPPPPDTAGTELPGDALRDIAALLEASERGDLVADFTVFSSTGTDHWTMASLLARECLRLAHAVYGDDLSSWIARFRKAGNAIDADLGGG